MASIVPHLLLVEDEPAVTHVIRATLDYGGFSNEAVGTAFDALLALDRRPYDAVLLDLGLPDVEGPHLVKLVRARCSVPIVVLSGRGSERDKIEALDHGADDFVEKPFLPGELLARLRAVMRRHGGAGPVERRPQSDELDEQPDDGTSFTRLETKLLELLESREGGVVSIEEIVEGVWGSDACRNVGHVRVLVAQLRLKLESADQPLRVETERGTGYRLVRAGSMPVLLRTA